MKIGFFKSNIDKIVIYLLLGLIMLLMPSDKIIDIIFIIIGVFIVLLNLNDIINAFKIKNYYNLIYGIINITLGLLLVFYHEVFILIIIGIYFIVIPLFNLILASNKQNQFLVDLPKYVIGIMLILLSPEFLMGIIIKSIGFILVLIAIFLIIASFYVEKEIH